ncbi:hypothetical protein F9C07_4746 [Aspergillus flavus]|uniref:Uncharacterized protein n=1 Tax=Aspergillus flavus (strain ATCC 200026 / FGSC A1120 / IAM 13836 / NRRL 3357 / JCM 12722 / SRRC 167) TaxID=332952 RepID=A0A7U2ML60_ASPFN|nr:hypothetical protein F9C07_4746 [Aspergillus flavus]
MATKTPNFRATFNFDLLQIRRKLCCIRQGVAKTQPDLTDLTETSASEIAQKG